MPRNAVFLLALVFKEYNVFLSQWTNSAVYLDKINGALTRYSILLLHTCCVNLRTRRHPRSILLNKHTCTNWGKKSFLFQKVCVFAFSCADVWEKNWGSLFDWITCMIVNCWFLCVWQYKNYYKSASLIWCTCCVNLSNIINKSIL